MKKSLYVIFVNYNSGKQLHDGVVMVLKSPCVTGIIIVDNASIDGSLEYLQKIKNTKKVLIIKNKKNLGFYKAVNTAIKKALKLNADMVMPLDFDLTFDSDFISKLFKIDGDIVVPVLKIKKNSKWFYDYGGKINWLTGSASHLLKARMVKNPKEQCDFVSGGCTIIKRKVLEKVGLFDEDYFLYFGDADYTLHAKEMGLKVVIDVTTIVHHKNEFSRQIGNIRKLKITFFDNLTFIHKRIPWFLQPVAYVNIFLTCVQVLFSVALKLVLE